MALASKNWIILTAYTPDYEWEFERLKASAKVISLPVYSRPIISSGDWRRDCEQTPVAILHWLETTPYSILWLDSDSIVIRYPELIDKIEIDGKDDMALYPRLNSASYAAHHKDDYPWHYETGTIYYRNNQKVKDFLKNQIKLLSDYKGQRRMSEFWYPSSDHLLKRPLCPVTIYPLPVEYAFPLGHRQPEEICTLPGGPVILQDMVGSRKRKERG
jgi:hypothetical protein